MTIAELLKNKYETMLKNMNARTWQNIKARSEYENKHAAEIMYMMIEITEFDIKANGGYNSELYNELRTMHKNKLLASNMHRQEHGHVDKWWLTKKGFKELNKIENLI